MQKLEDALRAGLGPSTGQLWDALKTRLASVAERIEKIKIPVPGAGTIDVDLAKAANDDWATLGNEILELLAELEQRWLIYLDELPIFLFNIVANDAACDASSIGSATTSVASPAATACAGSSPAPWVWTL